MPPGPPLSSELLTPINDLRNDANSTTFIFMFLSTLPIIYEITVNGIGIGTEFLGSNIRIFIWLSFVGLFFGIIGLNIPKIYFPGRKSFTFFSINHFIVPVAIFLVSYSIIPNAILALLITNGLHTLFELLEYMLVFISDKTETFSVEPRFNRYIDMFLALLGSIFGYYLIFGIQ